MIGLKKAALRLRGRNRDSGHDGDGGRDDGRSGPDTPPSPPAAGQGSGGEFAGSRLCNPRGLPGGMAPDLGRGIADVVGAAKADPPESDPKPKPPEPKQRKAGRRRKAGAGRGAAPAVAATAAPRLCAVLDTNAAVQYGRYAADLCSLSRVDEEFREILFDDSVEKVVTPAVMNEVHGLCRNGRLPEAAMKKIRALAVDGDDTEDASGAAERVAAAVEAEQRMVARANGTDRAKRWLAAKRWRYAKKTGEDYGPPHKMWWWGRSRHLARLCDLAAGDRKIMGEAAVVSARRPRTVLLSTDADVSLFDDALSRAAGGSISVVGIGPVGRRGRGR